MTETDEHTEAVQLLHNLTASNRNWEQVRLIMDYRNHVLEEAALVRDTAHEIRMLKR